MKCPNPKCSCKKFLPADANFCPECGTQLRPGKVVFIPDNPNISSNATSSNRLSEEEKLLTLALEEYAYEYKRFKTIWKVGIVLSIPFFFIFSILIWFAYTNYFRPQYELKLLKKYKEKYKLQ